MNKAILLLSALLIASVSSEEAPQEAKPADETPKLDNPLGFRIVGWGSDGPKKDLFDFWAEQNDNAKLKGSVAKFLDWPNVSRVVAIYNAWHIPATEKDIRILHLRDNLKNASFGDRFKGANPGGRYVLLFQYKNSDRQVLLDFREGVFLIESREGIGAVDVRKER